MAPDVTTAQAQVATLEAAALATDAANQQAQEQLRLGRLALADAQAALAAQVAAGTARTVSILDNALLAERQAGKQAAILHIQATPSCPQADAVAAWTTAALASRPADRQWLLQDGNSLLDEFMANAAAAGYIATPTWPAFAAWIAATPLAVLMED